MQSVVAGICGVVFGAGLAISGMTNPAKVLAFLDVTGRWDPTLAFVMGGALLVSTAGFALARRRERPWLSLSFGIPTRRDIDAPLVGGAALFGVGWGLVGLCPGPALASLSRGSAEIAIFVAAMIAGVVLHRWATRPGTLRRTGAPSTVELDVGGS
jgi:uncharacterized membrane protein YedE/YeeE